MSEHNINFIEDLVETLEDGQDGFEHVAERLEENGSGELAERMREFSAQRSKMSDELRKFAGSRGFEIEENGSAGGALHRGWISLKDALTGEGPEAVLAAAEEGEDHAVEQYESALERDDLDSATRALIEQQAAQVRTTHDEVRKLRDTATV